MFESRPGSWHQRCRTWLCRENCGGGYGHSRKTWLIRKVESAKNDWRDGRHDAASDLAQKAFSLNPTENVSVFQVCSPMEEAVAIAAIVAGSKNSPSDICGIRLFWRDLTEAGVDWAQTRGQTGLVSVDAHHFGIRASHESFARLSSGVLRRQASGADEIRVLRKAQLVVMWAEILEGRYGVLEDALSERLKSKVPR